MGGINNVSNRSADDWERSIKEFEARVGVRLTKLEDGDEEAAKIATRNLRKEFMKLVAQDAEKGHTQKKL